MNTETDIVERARIKAAMITMGEKIAFGSDSGIILELAAEVEHLRLEHEYACQEISVAIAERDAAARDMRERCAKIADDYDSDNAEDIASEIRALPDSQTVIATPCETVEQLQAEVASQDALAGFSDADRAAIPSHEGETL
jgi:hypothetical protein